MTLVLWDEQLVRHERRSKTEIPEVLGMIGFGAEVSK